MKGFLACSELNIPLSIFRPGLGWWGAGKPDPKTFWEAAPSEAPKHLMRYWRAGNKSQISWPLTVLNCWAWLAWLLHIKVPGGQKHISTKWNAHWLTLTSVPNILRTVTSIRDKKGCFQEYLHFVLVNISLTMRNLDGFPQNVMISKWKSPRIFKEPGTFLLKYKYLFKNTQKESSSFFLSEAFCVPLSILTHLQSLLMLNS